jgi:CRP/FNR family transcriptional regulator, cyclic AMP receptor protein
VSLESLKGKSRLLQGLSTEGMEFLESLASEIEFPSGAVIFDEDDPADALYLIAEGKVGLEVALHNKPAVLLETIGPGELLGVSWIIPPYTWNWRARSLTRTTAVAFSAPLVRQRCETDLNLALHVYKTIAVEAVRRLQAARIRLLDVFPGGER